jgi:hypothetical protein
MSETLTMVTPRPSGRTPASDAAPFGEPDVIARVPDLRAKSRAAAVPPASHHAASTVVHQEHDAPAPATYRVPRIPLSLPTVNVDMTKVSASLAAGWAWALSLPPIVKLGTLMVAVVVSIWMFGPNRKEAESTASSTSATNARETASSSSLSSTASTTNVKSLTAPAARTASESGTTWRWDSVAPSDRLPTANDLGLTSNATAPPAINSAPAVARAVGIDVDREHGEYASRNDVIVPSGVQPVKTHKEPYAPSAGTYATVEREPLYPNAGAASGSPRVPDMPASFADRNRPAESGLPRVQYNHHVSDAAGARSRESVPRYEGEFTGDPDVEAAARRDAYRGFREPRTANEPTYNGYERR